MHHAEGEGKGTSWEGSKRDVAKGLIERDMRETVHSIKGEGDARDCLWCDFGKDLDELLVWPRVLVGIVSAV